MYILYEMLTFKESYLESFISYRSKSYNDLYVKGTNISFHLPLDELNITNGAIWRRLVEFLVFNLIYLKKMFHLTR